MMMNIAITIIAYNRVDSLKRVLTSIDRAYYDQSVKLIISIDKSNTTIVEELADSYVWSHGEKVVIKHRENLGLRKHVLECGDRVCDYDAMIMLEDDVTVAESFFFYAKQCVKKYSDNDEIAGISLYSFPVCYINQIPFYPLHSDSDIFLMKCAQSWGQIWMPKQWNAFKNWYEDNNEEFDVNLSHLPKCICRWPKSSWLKYHTRYCIEQNKYFVYPYIALSSNNSDTGTHVGKRSTLFQSQLLYGKKEAYNLNPIIKYDGFFECENLYEVLNLSSNELCIDFNGEKKNHEGKRFWLTRQKMNYKILKSFALEYKPYEFNIINSVAGNQIFLYDTNTIEQNKLKEHRLAYIYYIYQFKNFKLLLKNILKIFNL